MGTDELKILTPIGMLGYSFNEGLFWNAVEDGVDAIILDSGSTDSGPAKLALGQTTASRQAYQRDLAILVEACHYHRVPVLIGSAAGDGTSAHVDLLVGIVTEIISARDFRRMKILTINAEIPKPTIQSKFSANLITPCGTSVPPLTQSDIDDATVVVAQMGLEPWLEAMSAHPDFDIIIAGRSYDPSPYAAFCMHRGIPDLGLAYHMGKIMECGAACAVPKSAEALAVVRAGSFDVLPLNREARCTPLSVAAHTLYEKTRPDLLAGPGGVLDLRDTKFEQLDDGKTCRVTGSRFMPSPKGSYTVKLEGARVTGHTAMFIGGIRDPIMVSQLDNLVPMIEARLRMVLSFKFELAIQFFGKDPLVKELGMPGVPTEVGVLGKVLAGTQDEAKAVANLAKVFFIHAPYAGQVATAGNLMMPFSPCDVSLGPAAEFCIYHLMQVDDPVKWFPFGVKVVGAEPSNKVTNGSRNGHARPKRASGNSPSLRDLSPKALPTITASQLSPLPPPGTTYLANIASVLRTKNCGPFEITIDIMFPDKAAYSLVKNAEVLSRKTLASIYGMEKDEDIVACMWWEPALAFKATIKRPVVSGGFHDADVHGSGWHVPLMYLKVPEVVGLDDAPLISGSYLTADRI